MKNHNMYNHRIKGEGVTAEYLCASDLTKSSVKKWLLYEKKDMSVTLVKSRIAVLRRDWILFMKDPAAYVSMLKQV